MTIRRVSSRGNQAHSQPSYAQEVVQVFLHVEKAWVQVDEHRQGEDGWIAYQVGRRVGIAGPRDWRRVEGGNGR